MKSYTKKQIAVAGSKVGIEFGKMEEMFKIMDTPNLIDICRICVYHATDYEHSRDYCRKGFDIENNQYCNTRNFIKKQ